MILMLRYKNRMLCAYYPQKFEILQEIESLQTQKNRILTKINDLERDYTEKLTAMNSLEERFTQTQEDYHTQSQDLENLRHGHEQLNEEVHFLQNQFDQYTEQIDQQHRELEALVARREMEQFKFSEDSEEITKTIQELEVKHSTIKSQTSDELESIKKSLVVARQVQT
jgi:chromosome segregation ATPase